MPSALQPCSSSPIKSRDASADNVVFPVPDNPKNSALTPLWPTLAEQCMGNTFRGGSRKFMTLKIDFFISPAYDVPPISTVQRMKFNRMKTSEFTPSRLGSAWNSGAEITVNSG